MMVLQGTQFPASSVSVYFNYVARFADQQQKTFRRVVTNDVQQAASPEKLLCWHFEALVPSTPSLKTSPTFSEALLPTPVTPRDSHETLLRANLHLGEESVAPGKETSEDFYSILASLVLVAMPFVSSSVLVASLLLVAMPFAPT